LGVLGKRRARDWRKKWLMKKKLWIPSAKKNGDLVLEGATRFRKKVKQIRGDREEGI